MRSKINFSHNSLINFSPNVPFLYPRKFQKHSGKSLHIKRFKINFACNYYDKQLRRKTHGNIKKIFVRNFFKDICTYYPREAKKTESGL